MFLSTLNREGATCCGGVEDVQDVAAGCCMAVARVVHRKVRGLTSLIPGFSWGFPELLLLVCAASVSAIVVAVGVLLLLVALLLASGVCSSTSWEPVVVEVVVAAVAAIAGVALVSYVVEAAASESESVTKSASSTNSGSYCSNSVSLPPIISGVVADDADEDEASSSCWLMKVAQAS